MSRTTIQTFLNFIMKMDTILGFYNEDEQCLSEHLWHYKCSSTQSFSTLFQKSSSERKFQTISSWILVREALTVGNFLTNFILGQVHTRYALNFAFSHTFLEILFNLQLNSVNLQTVLVDLQTVLIDLQIICLYSLWSLSI